FHYKAQLPGFINIGGGIFKVFLQNEFRIRRHRIAHFPDRSIVFQRIQKIQICWFKGAEADVFGGKEHAFWLMVVGCWLLVVQILLIVPLWRGLGGAFTVSDFFIGNAWSSPLPPPKGDKKRYLFQAKNSTICAETSPLKTCTAGPVK